MRRTAKVYLKSLSKYRSCRNHGIKKEVKEKTDAYTLRTWKELAHYDDKGFMMIPSVCFKKAVTSMAGLEKEKIEGKGNQEWGRRFKTGIRVVNGIRLPHKRETLKCDTFAMKRKDGKSVTVMFPVANEWEGGVEFHLYDSTITKEVFERYVREAGVRIGVGQGRVENGGENGCWEVKKVVWSEEKE
jgi:hypothetical protein